MTSLAIDRQGRVWAGRTISGVNVFDGHAWQSFGLLDGPLGESVHQIVISPLDGVVWIATNRGISRYNEADRTWSYLTRADGLPSDDIAGLAFAPDGTLYAATADSGVALARPADGYAAWTVIRATADVRGRASGEGLCSDWCDAVLTIGPNVFVGGAGGLSCSRDGGKTWAFVRGENWLAKAKNATHPPASMDAQTNVPMAEDAVTCLGISDDGKLLVGHPLSPMDVLDPETLANIETLDSHTEGACAVAHGAQTFIATGDEGVMRLQGTTLTPISTANRGDGGEPFSQNAAGLPAPAAAPTAAALRALAVRVKALPAPTVQAGALGTDWATGGDVWNHYGWDYRIWPHFGAADVNGSGVSVRVRVGPHLLDGDGVYTNFESTDTLNPRSLFLAAKGKREQGEWNDASWQTDKYPRSFEGPDLWFSVTVPGGPHRISMYLMNNDAAEVPDRRARDYLIELKPAPTDGSLPDDAPAVARIRARRFEPGFYAQFQVGPGDWWIKVVRNGSACTKVSGVFVDDLVLHGLNAASAAVSSGKEIDIAPTWDGQFDAANERVAAAVELWRALDGARDRDAAIDLAYRLLAVRAIEAETGNESLKSFTHAWVPVWTDIDRIEWRDRVTAAWQASAAKQTNPQNGQDP